MSHSPNVVIVDSQNFVKEVLEKSKKVPVLVDFWADWCAPCKMLLPVLNQLVEDYQGQFVLAKVNTDEQRELATQFNIRSIPALKLFRHGKVVEEIVGVQPEASLRALIDRHRDRPADKLRHQAREAYQRGDTEKALNLLEQARAGEPTYYAIHQEIASILIESQRFEEAEQLLKSLPANVQMEPGINQLVIHLKFSSLAASAPAKQELERILEADPNHSLARYQLSAHFVSSGDYESALQHLLELLRRDRRFNEEAARKGLLDIFTLLGNQGELVSRYRGKMSLLLY